MAKNQWIIEDAPIVQQPESFLSQAKRVGTSTGLKALQNLENLGGLVKSGLEFVGLEDPHRKLVQQGKIPAQQDISDIIAQKFNLTPEYLEPQSGLESSIQRFGSQAPLAGLLGGLTGLQALGVGTGAAAGARALGAPEGIQDIAQLVTEIPTGIGLGIKRGRIPTISGAQKAEYELAKAAVKPGTKTSAKVIQDSFNTVAQELGTEVSEKNASKINKALSTIEQNIIKGEIHPNTALDLRKKLYKLTREVPADVAKTYIEPLTKGINDYFSVYAAENPQFYKHLKSADKLTALKHMKTYLDKGLSSLELGKLPFGKAITDVTNLGLKEGEKFIKGLATNSAARDYYFKAVKGVAKNNPNLVAKYLNKSLEQLPEFKEQNHWVIE